MQADLDCHSVDDFREMKITISQARFSSRKLLEIHRQVERNFGKVIRSSRSITSISASIHTKKLSILFEILANWNWKSVWRIPWKNHWTIFDIVYLRKNSKYRDIVQRSSKTRFSLGITSSKRNVYLRNCQCPIEFLSQSL